MSVERWSIWRANLDPVVGSEQGRTRPVLVISETAANDILPVVNVLPITSRKSGRRVYPNEALLALGTAGLTEESLVLTYQIRTLDKRRLSRSYGKLDDTGQQERILAALCFQLGVKRIDSPTDA
ncbi:MAG: type II toxin-antitoxin system PemK/MazF family toxin [Acidobacteriota bacterium]